MCAYSQGCAEKGQEFKCKRKGSVLAKARVLGMNRKLRVGGNSGCPPECRGEGTVQCRSVAVQPAHPLNASFFPLVLPPPSLGSLEGWAKPPPLPCSLRGRKVLFYQTSQVTNVEHCPFSASPVPSIRQPLPPWVTFLRSRSG